MIEISFGKLLLLAVIALLVLGPEKLPGAARTAGAMLRRVRGAWDSVRAEVERELEIEEIKRTARDAAARAEAAQAEVRKATEQVRQAVAFDLPDAPAAADDALADPASSEEEAPVDTRTGDLFADTPAHPTPKDTPRGDA